MCRRGTHAAFGGLAAVNEVSLRLGARRVHAVIGPNGAGKSTLTNLLSGDLAPTGGRVTLLGAGRDALEPQPRRARAGLGRSYQSTNIFPPFTVCENCRLAAQARLQRHGRSARRRKRLHRRARRRPSARSSAPASRREAARSPARCRTASSASWRSR